MEKIEGRKSWLNNEKMKMTMKWGKLWYPTSPVILLLPLTPLKTFDGVSFHFVSSISLHPLPLKRKFSIVSLRCAGIIRNGWEMRSGNSKKSHWDEERTQYRMCVMHVLRIRKTFQIQMEHSAVLLAFLICEWSVGRELSLLCILFHSNSISSNYN